MAAIAVTGNPPTDPLGAPAATPYNLTPYGSAVLRAGTERNAATFDCVPGAVGIANAAIAFSNFGRVAPPTGSIGRYALSALLPPPPLASATARRRRRHRPRRRCRRLPPVRRHRRPPATAGRAAAASGAASGRRLPVGPGRIVSSSLRLRAARIALEIRCVRPRSAAARACCRCARRSGSVSAGA